MCASSTPQVHFTSVFLETDSYNWLGVNILVVELNESLPEKEVTNCSQGYSI